MAEVVQTIIAICLFLTEAARKLHGANEAASLSKYYYYYQNIHTYIHTYNLLSLSFANAFLKKKKSNYICIRIAWHNLIHMLRRKTKTR